MLAERQKIINRKHNKLLQKVKSVIVFFKNQSKIKSFNRFGKGGVQINMLDTERQIFDQSFEEIGGCIHEYIWENIPVREQDQCNALRETRS